jgi:hypothetical protein
MLMTGSYSDHVNSKDKPILSGQRAGVERVTSKIQLLLPFVLLFCLAGNGVREFFVGDEIMNLFKYLQHPPSWWLNGVIQFWSSKYYRPLGGLAHIVLYGIFGFHPLPFKVFLLIALALNLALYYRVSIRLSGSRQIASWALLLCCYHAAFAGLYLNFGTIYDVLGYSCFFCALLIYGRWVHEGARRVVGVVAVVLLYIAGLEFKEIAVTLPAVLLGYNVLVARSPQPAQFRWRIRSTLPVVLCAPIGAIYAFGKMSGPDALTMYSTYTPHFTLGQYGAISAHYIRQIFYLSEKLPTPAGALWILAATITAGLCLRSRLMVFCAVSAILSQLPVSFISPRGAFAIYISFAFWGLYAAVLLDRAVCFPAHPRPVFAVWLTVAASLAILHFHMKPTFDPPFTRQAVSYENFSRQLEYWGVRVSSRSRILMVNDPFPAIWIGWDPMFLINLQFHTTEAIVNRTKFASFLLPHSELSSYDYIIDYDSGWLLLKQPGKPAVPSRNMQQRTASASVLLTDGFQLPSQGLWRQTDPVFAIQTRCNSRPHMLAVSLVSYSPARLSVQLDDRQPVDEGIQPAPNIELALPIPAGSSPQEHTFTFRSIPGASPLFFVDARLY